MSAFWSLFEEHGRSLWALVCDETLRAAFVGLEVEEDRARVVSVAIPPGIEQAHVDNSDEVDKELVYGCHICE